jgi:hypothetical protein
MANRHFLSAMGHLSCLQLRLTMHTTPMPRFPHTSVLPVVKNLCSQTNDDMPVKTYSSLALPKNCFTQWGISFASSIKQ